MSLKTQKFIVDDNKKAITLIRKIINNIVNCKIVLFGSRAGRDYNLKSDYDLLVIIEKTIPIPKKIRLATTIKKALLNKDIVADVVVQSEGEVEVKKNLIGNVVRYALQEGVSI